MSTADDLHLIADLIASRKTKAAERLTVALAELETERDAHQRFEFEALWLLRHAAELPCHVQLDEKNGTPFVKGAERANPDGGPCDYVLRDCYRLQALLRGDFKGR